MDVKPYKLPAPFKKLSKELIDIIVKDIEEGSTQRFAAEANGITERIFLIWVKQGRVDIEYENESSLPAYLVRSLSKIKQIEVKWCRDAIKRNPKGHQGAEWTLEHAYWREYGPDERIKVLADQMEQDYLQSIENINPVM